MGNTPSEEEAAVGLAPGTQQIRPIEEPAFAERQPHGNEIVDPSSYGDAGEDAPSEGENATLTPRCRTRHFAKVMFNCHLPKQS